jgi:nitroimidazol reductase NimA-like FMN-containing flavoprotein (pyridoxamine 5'-phosphate oxidase superfamily)
MEGMTTTTLLATLTPAECEALLANGSVGRLAVVVGDQPHIVPVNYVADGATIVFRTGPETVLTEASLNKVAFEVDGIHETLRAGWSVCVHGYGREISDCVDDESRRLQALYVDTWAPDGRDRWFKIDPATVSGRALGPAVRTTAHR